MNAAKDDEKKGSLLVLDVLEALAGYAATGAKNSELAELTKTTAPNITRAMALLVVALCVAGIACCALTQRWMRRHDAPLAHPRARTP